MDTVTRTAFFTKPEMQATLDRLRQDMRATLRSGNFPTREEFLLAILADLKLNPHLHVAFLDGVYTPSTEGRLVFRALPHLSTTDAGGCGAGDVCDLPLEQLTLATFKKTLG